MVNIKDVELVVNNANIHLCEQIKRRLAKIKPNEKGQLSDEQLDIIFEGMPQLRKLFTPG